ncbi:hypothetical protein A0H81_04392 [Grifola frondosa]|uniref:Uncharacterized protein n=1 Tax=Grifola frondosa TaxID=5627 RepID=A0A1C7MFW7_GRIFR|nr:hypothetical protein A0H81_04392 [Grifola frondosa]
MSRPTARVGLPSSPSSLRSRSYTAGQTRQDILSRPNNTVSEQPQRGRPPPSPSPRLPTPQLRPQRSLGNLSTNASAQYGRSRSVDRRAEPLPPMPSLPPLPEARRFGVAPRRVDAYADSADDPSQYDAFRRGSDASVASSSSMSSGASSLRAHSKSSSSVASSLTSLEEDSSDTVKADDDTGSDVSEKVPAGFGSSLWSRVAVVASNLTVNVSKAWATNVATFSGEETPPGQESRLTRAMKAYHIEKARDPADLPEWLFEERERGVTGRFRSADKSASNAAEMRVERNANIPQPTMNTRRDVSEVVQSTYGRSVGDTYLSGGESRPSKPTDRLRELREIKRSATKVHFTDQVGPRRAAENRANPGNNELPPRRTPAAIEVNVNVNTGRQISGRVGLPSSIKPQRG